MKGFFKKKIFKLGITKQDIYLALLALVISIGTQGLLWITASSDGPLFKVLLSGILVLIISIILIIGDRELRESVRKNSNVISLMLVIFTLVITLAAFYVDRLGKKVQIDKALANISILNYQYADEITRDKENEWIYWRYLSLKPYEENFSYVMTNYPRKCVLRFAGIVRSTEVINEMNRVINENSAWVVVAKNMREASAYNDIFIERKQELLSRAEEFKNSIRDFLLDCYDIQLPAS